MPASTKSLALRSITSAAMLAAQNAEAAWRARYAVTGFPRRGRVSKTGARRRAKREFLKTLPRATRRLAAL